MFPVFQSASTISREVVDMKRNSITSVIAAALILMTGIALLCVYAKELKRFCKIFWDKLEAKQANLKLYMQ
jgi:ABC-type spermidine/putrescine transport system permease subunit II